jgi:hypothetical protein
MCTQLNCLEVVGVREHGHKAFRLHETKVLDQLRNPRKALYKAVRLLVRPTQLLYDCFLGCYAM